MKKVIKGALVGGATVLLAVQLTACGNGESSASGDAGTSKEVELAYQDNGDNTALDQWMQTIKKDFESKNQGAVLKLVPLKANGDDYGNKLSLMNGSEETAPDLMFLDSSMLRPYAESEYLAPLDEYLNGWSDWAQYFDNVKAVGQADDSMTYGVPLGTDTRGIWYRKDILSSVGIKDGWQPKSWDELLDVARKIKEKNPDVIPLNLYTGKAQGETGVMQGFEMLLYGTKGGTLYDSSAQKWIASSQQLKDSLGFINTLFTEGLGPTPQQASDPQLGNRVPGEWLPEGKLAMTVDGNWLNSSWQKGGDYEWADWQDKIGWTGFPTQDGNATNTTMSGGWVVAMSNQTENKDLAFKAIEVMQNKDNAKAYDIGMGQIAVRSDIESDPEYLGNNPTIEFFTKLAENSHFRPMTSEYNEVSAMISESTEAVMTGQKSVDEAMEEYSDSLISTFGEDGVTRQ